MSNKNQIFDIETVSKHNSENDAWIIVKGDVFDVTTFIPYHPGGKAIILNNLGSDLTEAFGSPDIHEHSEKAYRMLSNYKIGSLDSKTGTSSTMDEKLMSAIDLNKPIVNQVFNMSPKLYQEWLHKSPNAISIRLFETAFLEFFSHYPWWYIFPLWIPVMFYGVINSYLNGYSPYGIILSFASGLLFWTFLEYCAHRWLFHMVTESHIGNFYHFMAHGIHHLSPLDPTRLTFPPVFSVFIVAGLYKLLSNFGIPIYDSFFVGALCGYVLYDTVHFFFHHGTICDYVPYLKMMRSRHFKHHYVCPDRNFGVSSPIWDYVFGSNEIPNEPIILQAH